MNRSYRTLLFSDNELFCRGLNEILNRTKDIRAEEARDQNELLKKLRTGIYSISIIGVISSGTDGIELLSRIKKACPKIPVLIVSMFDESHTGVRFIRSGADGYIGMEGTVNDLVSAVKKLIEGGKYITDSIAQYMAGMINTKANQTPVELLSNREFQVFKMLAAGINSYEIADQLFLSEKTISTYKKRILEKLSCKNGVELAKFAISEHLIQVS